MRDEDRYTQFTSQADGPADDVSFKYPNTPIPPLYFIWCVSLRVGWSQELLS